MADFRWPIVVTTAVLTLALFFGINYYRQRYMKEEPFLEALEKLESIDEAVITQKNEAVTLNITPAENYSGSLQEIVLHVQELTAEKYNQPLNIIVRDRRNDTLESFARSVTPALYEGVRLANYRSVDESIKLLAARYQLDAVLFSVDDDHLYLQARDQEYVLYLLIPLNRTEGAT
jgi:hypothetical protein